MQFGKADWWTFERGTEKEWLLANGIGGFACSTLIGANTRRYHGLLVAALNPPVRRHLILSKIDESISVGNKKYEIYSSRTGDFTMEGFRYLNRAEIGPVPTFVFSVEDVLIEKKVVMLYGRNTVCIVYHVKNGSTKSVLRLAPLVNFRDYHQNSFRQHMRFSVKEKEKGAVICPYDLDLEIRLTMDSGRFVRQEDNWFFNMYYAVEEERGLEPYEDHFIPGLFELDLKEYEEKLVTLTASIEGDEYLDGISIAEAELERVEKLKSKSGLKDTFALELVRAADQFIVDRRSTGARTIIAGYPWFTDWGRDTMIAFTGLTLVTGRFDDAREILHTFAVHEKDGLLPNVFPDAGEQPAYNSVDAPLWFFEAAYKYLLYTGDLKFISDEIYPVLKRIAEHFRKGTHFGISADADGLIRAGNEETQLTWMDAMVWGRAVTPRHGKAVEINALWYNALKVMERLSLAIGEDPACYGDLSSLVRESFTAVFWNESGQCLYDCVYNGFKDERIRPNQILAASLSFPVLDPKYAGKVVEKVWKDLYTACGLKSLSKASPEYTGVYAGDPGRRDSGYHQGTVWVWPLGHFITAYLKAFGISEKSRRAAMEFIKPFCSHLRDGCIGSISEIFDAEEPHRPRGCFAQAWSVAEVLRVYIEDIAGIAPGRS